MQRFKKRIRILADELNGVMDYGHDGSIGLRFETGYVRFRSTSNEAMACCVDWGEGPRSFRVNKEFCFDIVDRLAAAQLAHTLCEYPMPQLLRIDDFVNEEQGASCLRSLREEIAANPALVSKELGGNRILVRYYRGVLILRDDLVWGGTNVVEIEVLGDAIRDATK